MGRLYSFKFCIGSTSTAQKKKKKEDEKQQKYLQQPTNTNPSLPCKTKQLALN